MRKKIFIVSVLMMMLFVSGTSAFAAVKCELPSKLKAVFEVFTNSEVSAPDNITMNLYGRELTVVDFSYYERHKDTIFWIIRAVIYPYIIIFNYDNLLRVLGSSRYTASIQFTHKETKDNVS